ncbi:MAG: hypothetical protein QXY45_01750 [Candidatus Aenigmatarchaeota archaeon]
MPEKVILECPFCHKKTINAIYHPPTLQTSISRAAGRTATRYYQTKEKYEISSDCPNCGKKSNQIQKAINEGKISKNEKRIIERLKKEGLFRVEIKTKISDY